MGAGDHQLIIGDGYRVTLTVEVAGVARDITGLTGTATLSTTPGFRLVASPTVAILVAASGTLTVTLTAEQTALITPADYQLAVQVTFLGDTEPTTIYAPIVTAVRVR